MFPYPKHNNGTALTGGAGTTTTTIDAASKSYLRIGDTIYFINRIDRDIACSTTLTANVDEGDTSLNYSTMTPANDVFEDTEIAIDLNELIATAVVRAASKLQVGGFTAFSQIQMLYCVTTNNTPKEATTDGAAGSGATNRIPVPQ
jgi:hypothetical protein